MSFLASYLRFDVHGISQVIVALFNLALGTIVLVQNRHGAVNRAFFLLTVFTTIWILTFGMMSFVRQANDAYYWLSWSYIGVPFISVATYQFSVRWRGERSTKLIAFGYAFAFLIMLPMTISPSKLCYFEEYSWGRYPRFISHPLTTAYYFTVLISFYSYAFMAFANFFRGWKSALSPLERRQSGAIVIAVFIAYTGSVDFATSIRGNIYPFGYLSLTMFLCLVAYTIVRYRIFDINIMVRRASAVALIYTMLLVICLPISIIILKPVFHLLPQQAFGPVVSFALFVGFSLSLGPAFYGYILRTTYWLRRGESSGLVHELKSPLGAIRGAVELAGDAAQCGKPVGDYLDMIKRNSTRLEIFVQDLLMLAKVQENAIYLRMEDIDLAKVASDVIDSHRSTALARRLQFDARLESVRVRGDTQKIAQAISNLVSNAIKFSDQGKVSVLLERDDKLAKFSVIDEGAGIPAVLTDRIFDRFFQEMPNRGGAGLGLAIAKAWVEAHGGRIWAESKGLGKGTTVAFTIPATAKHIGVMAANPKIGF